MTKRISYQELEDAELSEEQADMINQFVIQAEKDIEEAKVNCKIVQSIFI